jgi:hypothetical protein
MNFLMVQKHLRPDHFRQALRVSPATFDEIVTKISLDPVFFNNSDWQQLAVALYRFGHDGNATSLQSVANWAGLGKGTILLCTRRVMAAILRPRFMKEAVQMPTAADKEEAKVWVDAHSCHAWQNGWCFVDGTLVPLANRPYWFGESYFDRKCNYSLNIQVRINYSLFTKVKLIYECSKIVSLPNLQIIDFSYGHTGSTHDSTAWESTQMAQKHEELLEKDEWIWADSAYPVTCVFLWKLG